jgi:hypothetical protein
VPEHASFHFQLFAVASHYQPESGESWELAATQHHQFKYMISEQPAMLKHPQVVESSAYRP